MSILPSTTASWSRRRLGAVGLSFLLGLIFILGAGAAHAERGVGYTASGGDLYLLDLETGDIGLVGSMGIGTFSLFAMTWGPDGFLYGLGSDIPSPSDALYRIDPATGSATLIGDLGIEDASGLVFDTDGTLWLSSSYLSETLYRVDPATAVPTAVHDLGMPIYHLVFYGDQLYSFTSELVAIDRDTGLVTPAHPIWGVGAYLTGAAFDSKGTLWLITHPPALGLVDHVDYYKVLNLPGGEIIHTFYGVSLPGDPLIFTRGLAMTTGLQVVEIPTLDAVGGVAFAMLLAAGGFRVAVRRSRRATCTSTVLSP